MEPEKLWQANKWPCSMYADAVMTLWAGRLSGAGCRYVGTYVAEAAAYELPCLAVVCVHQGAAAVEQPCVGPPHHLPK